MKHLAPPNAKPVVRFNESRTFVDVRPAWFRGKSKLGQVHANRLGNRMSVSRGFIVLLIMFAPSHTGVS